MSATTLRVRSVPGKTTADELVSTFGVSPSSVSLALTESGDSLMTATVTFKDPKTAHQYLKTRVHIHGEQLLIDDTFLDLTVLSRHDDDIVDIIAIHGLNGHAFNTWASGEVMWLRDFLPGHFPQARIMTYGYDSNVRNSDVVSGISDFAKKLLVLLVDYRQGKEEKERPIIFICHSLGGIVVKAALNIAREEERTHIINRVTRGVIFLATPHGGSATADYGRLIGSIFTALDVRKELVQDLVSNSRSLSQISGAFREHYDSLEIATFYETKKTVVRRAKLFKFLNEVVVDKQSAVLQLKHEQQTPLHRDHREICRFSHKEEEDYKAVRKQVERLCKVSIPIVSTADGSNFSAPEGLKLCAEGSPYPYTSYPVLLWGGYTYWPLSYMDNRYAMAIVAIDQRNNVVRTVAANGARYIRKIEVNTAEQKICFHGQADRVTSLSWQSLDVRLT